MLCHCVPLFLFDQSHSNIYIHSVLDQSMGSGLNLVVMRMLQGQFGHGHVSHFYEMIGAVSGWGLIKPYLAGV
uniref:Uncharacterized protein n=1 Tax=Rhizophora mucronata TaxID=61149 RepID=A0A2P2Q9F5_RHIMU